MAFLRSVDILLIVFSRFLSKEFKTVPISLFKPTVASFRLPADVPIFSAAVAILLDALTIVFEFVSLACMNEFTASCNCTIEPFMYPIASIVLPARSSSRRDFVCEISFADFSSFTICSDSFSFLSSVIWFCSSTILLEEISRSTATQSFSIASIVLPARSSSRRDFVCEISFADFSSFTICSDSFSFLSSVIWFCSSTILLEEISRSTATQSFSIASIVLPARSSSSFAFTFLSLSNWFFIFFIHHSNLRSSKRLIVAHDLNAKKPKMPHVDVLNFAPMPSIIPIRLFMALSMPAVCTC